jgi:hypothetical protein
MRSDHHEDRDSRNGFGKAGVAGSRVDAQGNAVLCEKLNRSGVLEFFASLPPAEKHS